MDKSAEVRNPLERLKSTILSIDWEITDECLSDLVSESDRLLPLYRNNPYAHALLRILRTLGHYMRKHKAQSHQEAIKRIMSAFASLEKIVADEPIAESQQKQIATMEVLAFKNLKSKIERQHAPQPIMAPVAFGAEAPRCLDPATFQQALDAVEKRLNRQMEQLKSQIAALHQLLSQSRGK